MFILKNFRTGDVVEITTEGNSVFSLMGYDVRTRTAFVITRRYSGEAVVANGDLRVGGQFRYSLKNTNGRCGRISASGIKSIRVNGEELAA